MDPNRFKMQFEVKKVAPDFFKPHDLAQCSSVLVLTPAKQAAKVFWVSDLPAIKEQGQTYRWIRVIEPQSDIFSAAMIEVGVRENNYFFEVCSAYASANGQKQLDLVSSSIVESCAVGSTRRHRQFKIPTRRRHPDVLSSSQRFTWSCCQSQRLHDVCEV